MGNMFLSIFLLVMIRLLKKLICQWTASRTEIEATTGIRKRMSVPFRYNPKDVYRTFRQMTNERNLSDTRISGTTRRRWKTKKMQERHQSDFQFSQRVFFAKGASCADSCRIAVVISSTKDIISVLSDRSQSSTLNLWHVILNVLQLLTEREIFWTVNLNGTESVNKDMLTCIIAPVSPKARQRTILLLWRRRCRLQEDNQGTIPTTRYICRTRHVIPHWSKMDPYDTSTDKSKKLVHAVILNIF